MYDDSDTRRDVVESHLALVDAQFVRSGAEVIELFESEPGNPVADMVMLDLNIADGSGIDVLRYLRSSDAGKHVPVIVLSCSQRDEDATACIEEGANAFISKPARFPDLRRAILNTVDFWACTRAPERATAGQH